MKALQTARSYLKRGWMPLPIPVRSKRPVLPEWQSFRVTESELAAKFDGQSMNIGVLLGEPSGGLVDVDLDCPQAIALASHFLPATDAVFGRAGRDRSHWLYKADPIPKTTRYKDVDGAVIVELRGTGTQTVFPESIHPSDETIVWDSDGAPKSIGGSALETIVRMLAVATLLARHWPSKGSRHDAALALAGGLHRSQRIPPDEIAAFIQAVADAGGSDPNHQHADAARYTGQRIAEGGSATGFPTLAGLLRGDGTGVVKRVRMWLGCEDESSHDRTYHLSDTGNAGRLADRNVENLRYWHQSDRTGTWLVWTGVQWQPDGDGAAQRMAKETALSIYDEAKHAADEKRESIVKWALHSESDPRIRAMLNLAKSEKVLGVRTDQLDRDPWLLNVSNGTIDLRSGGLRRHCRDDLLTKLAPVDYHAEAEAPLWQRFLTEIMCGDRTLVEYLQRLLGMCLTADISEQILPIFWGDGGNGKNVLVDTIKGVMGDYAADAPPDLLTVRRSCEHPTEIADLLGKRLVVASETEEGRQLRVQLVKRLTGDRTLKGRYMRQDFFEFVRTHKTVLITNNKPVVREDKHSLWRRVRLVPFRYTVPPGREDRQLTEKLQAEWPGILHWLVEGCLQWQRAGGLVEPTPVVRATKEYRDEQNVLGPFLDERCVLNQAARVTRAAIWRAYHEWASKSGEQYPLDRSGLYERLRIRGFDDKSFRENGRNVRGFVGVGLVGGPKNGVDAGGAG